MNHDYTPDADGWLAFVAGDRALLLGGSPDAELIESAWDAIREDRGLEPVLELLTARGLAATPPFAVVEVGQSETRAVVRGGVTVQVAGEPALSGASLASWAERSFPAGSMPTLQVDGRSGGSVLPIESGAVRTSAVVFGGRLVADVADVADVAATPVPPAAPAPPAEPAPAVAEATIAELPEPAAGAEAPPAAEEEGYDYLFGETVFRSVRDAAVPEDSPEDLEPAAAAPAGDHDGETILATDLKKLRGGRTSKPVASAAPPPPAPASVLVLPSGAREPVTGTILVGRAPSIRQVPGAKLPRLVTIAGHDQDISRNHVQVALEGDTVVVTDLHSKNGTTVRMPGRDPQKLRAGEPTSVIVGTVVDLGGGVELIVEPS